MSKTLGQIAHHSWQDRLGCDQNRWEQLDEYVQLAWQAATNAVIEECAKVAEADDSFMMFQDWGLQNAVTQKGVNIAKSIRSLKTSTGETANE